MSLSGMTWRLAGSSAEVLHGELWPGSVSMHACTWPHLSAAGCTQPVEHLAVRPVAYAKPHMYGTHATPCAALHAACVLLTYLPCLGPASLLPKICLLQSIHYMVTGA